MNDIKQFDNITQTVADDLKVQLGKGGKVCVAAACFSFYAFEALKRELENIDEFRFIFTSPAFTKDFSSKQKREFYIPKLQRERTLFGSDFELRLRNKMSQRAIARECAQWIQQKARFKSNVSGGSVNGFLTCTNTEGKYVYMPFNEFTTTELGLERGNNLCPGVIRLSSPMADGYIRNFNELWNDERQFKDVTDQIIDNISNVYKENAPEFIYFITLYNIFKEFLDDISEDFLPNEATGFKSSQVWNKLYDFQKDAALAIINKLEKFNGCILADSVGLGKTFTALAVIKYYENRNKSVLVLCPKKLNDNWITYRSNYVNNPIAKDRLRYDILFHSDLSRTGGQTNGLDLSHINWGNYDLVVIDESHNFRNGGKLSGDDENPKENRYLQLMNKVIKAGVKTKVLMLSATPVNNRFNDLKNQLQLAYEGDTENINGLLNTENSIDEIFRRAQRAYNVWAKMPNEQRTTEVLLGMLDFDFFEVLDSVTIARSRKHIEAYYNTEAVGKFPTRLPPISRRPSLTDLPNAINYNEIYEQLQKLNLAIYTPSAFILPSALHKYVDADDEMGHRLTLEGREMGIRRLMSINMLKRLESSVNSFRLTLQRIEKVIAGTVERIDKRESELVVEEAIMPDLDIDDQDNDMFIGTKKNKILLDDMDYVSWRESLA
ncbi:MAG: SNF2-related protein, partial [Candidatus Cryptobacteroides sp.]